MNRTSLLSLRRFSIMAKYAFAPEPPPEEPLPGQGQGKRARRRRNKKAQRLAAQQRSLFQQRSSSKPLSVVLDFDAEHAYSGTAEAHHFSMVGVGLKSQGQSNVGVGNHDNHRNLSELASLDYDVSAFDATSLNGDVSTFDATSLNSLNGVSTLDATSLNHDVSTLDATSLNHDVSAFAAHTPMVGKVARVALLGLPNAGKSSLMNAVVQSKVSAVSRISQTTRRDTEAAWTRENRDHSMDQLVFVDTPGVIARDKQKSIDPWLVASSWDSLQYVSHVCVVVDAGTCGESFSGNFRDMFVRLGEVLNKITNATPSEKDTEWEDNTLNSNNAENAKNFHFHSKSKSKSKSKSPLLVSLVVQKSDLLREHATSEERVRDWLKKMYMLAERSGFTFDQFSFVSAHTSRGIRALAKRLIDTYGEPDQELLYERGKASGQSLDEIMEELVREKVYRASRQEIPYVVEIERVGAFHDGDGNRVVEYRLIVERPGQQKILVGQKGTVIKRIAEKTQEDIKKYLGIDILVHCTVTTRSK